MTTGCQGRTPDGVASDSEVSPRTVLLSIEVGVSAAPAVAVGEGWVGVFVGVTILVGDGVGVLVGVGNGVGDGVGVGIGVAVGVAVSVHTGVGSPYISFAPTMYWGSLLIVNFICSFRHKTNEANSLINSSFVIAQIFWLN